MFVITFFCFQCLPILFTINFALCLSPFLLDYQTLNYNPISIKRKRAVEHDTSPINLKFTSHNRSFHLSLLSLDADLQPFDRNLVVDVDGTSVNLDPQRFLYYGHDRSDEGSVVYGSILDGVFDGHIHYTNGDSFTVDKISRYFPLHNRSFSFHSVIYHDKSINHPKFRRKRSLDDMGFGCALNKEIQQEMNRIQKNVIIEDPEEQCEDASSCRYFPDRWKRDTDSVKSINGKQIYSVRSCYVYLQADHKLYSHIFEKEGNSDHVRTREEIASLFYNHIKAVNQIYESTNFRGIQGINFVIQRISIYTQESCKDGRSRPGFDNPFCEENVDVSNFLNLNSRKNHSAFCLAYAFTFRDFVGGTLGLAWVASPNHNTAGGICQQFTKYSEGTSFVHRSLNTGIITLVNYGNRVPTRVSHLTLAHEIGHNFGSPHDFPAECQPGLPDGNYIMFASATSGDKYNNAKFSTCSIANISMVLAEVLQQRPIAADSLIRGGFSSGKRNCFRETKSAFCGNQVREPGEECDCGFTDTDCNTMNDICCQAREERGKAVQNGCKRKPNAQCSPSEGPCCNAKQCSFHGSYENKICRAESDCLEKQKCDGIGAACPESVAKRDGLPCQDSTKVCNTGSCNGSICVQVGLKDCFLTQGSPEALCHLACEVSNGTCVSSLKLPQFRVGEFHQNGRDNKAGLVLLPGSPCNNYKGYCDIFRKCRSVDADGPLARLKNVIFNPKTLYEVRYWIQVNWWIVLIGGLFLLIFLAVFIKCCAVHTPSTNPNKPPALNIYDTLRRPRTLIRRTRNPLPISQERMVNATEVPRRQNGHVSTGRVAAQSFNPVRLAQPVPRILPSSTNIIVVEPPPPYTASSDPASALGGPKRGHRKNKKRSRVEVRSKARK